MSPEVWKEKADRVVWNETTTVDESGFVLLSGDEEWNRNSMWGGYVSRSLFGSLALVEVGPKDVWDYRRTELVKRDGSPLRDTARTTPLRLLKKAFQRAEVEGLRIQEGVLEALDPKLEVPYSPPSTPENIVIPSPKKVRNFSEGISSQRDTSHYSAREDWYNYPSLKLLLARLSTEFPPAPRCPSWGDVVRTADLISPSWREDFVYVRFCTRSKADAVCRIEWTLYSQVQKWFPSERSPRPRHPLGEGCLDPDLVKLALFVKGRDSIRSKTPYPRATSLVFEDAGICEVSFGEPKNQKLIYAARRAESPNDYFKVGISNTGTRQLLKMGLLVSHVVLVNGVEVKTTEDKIKMRLGERYPLAGGSSKTEEFRVPWKNGLEIWYGVLVEDRLVKQLKTKSPSILKL